MKEDLLKIIKHFGINTQQRKLAEEIFELQEQISIYEQVHDWDSNDYFMGIVPEKDGISEELADVIVLLKQIFYYYKFDENEIKKLEQNKINRTLERIESGYYEKPDNC